MRPFTRGDEPGFLTPVWETWGREWEALQKRNPKAQFQWRKIDGTPVNHRLLSPLLELTQGHCSFCDNYPLTTQVPTIEHFRPKSQFPRDAYRWTNLYACCHHCQQKGDDYDEQLLQPDDPDYTFDRYFYWDYTTGHLCVLEEASTEDRARAEVTIRLYRLNIDHPRYRLEEQAKRAQAGGLDLDVFPYRDFVEGR